MRRPEEVKREFVREWFRKAEEDLRTSQHLLKAGAGYVYGAVFHAQQAAEKYLKAFLVWHQIEFPKTHDIEVLLTLAAGANTGFAEALAGAAWLTPYGVEYRYPGDYPEATLKDAKQATGLAASVRAETVRRLPEDSLP